MNWKAKMDKFLGSSTLCTQFWLLMDAPREVRVGRGVGGLREGGWKDGLRTINVSFFAHFSTYLWL